MTIGKKLHSPTQSDPYLGPTCSNFVKPFTSRPANSEKYLVCVGFLDNISEREIYKLLLDIPKIGSTIFLLYT